MRRAIAWIAWLARITWLGAVLVLPEMASAADIQITSLPFDAAGASGDRYYLAGDLTCTSGVAILIDTGNATLDGQGHTITVSSSSSHGVQITASTCTVKDLTILRTATGTGTGLIGSSGIVYHAQRVKVVQDATGANDYAVRFQGADDAEDCLFVRTVTGTVAACGATGGWSWINCTFVHTGTTGNVLTAASNTSTGTLKNNVFKCAGAAVPIAFTSVSGVTATFASNVYYRSNTGTVVTYPSGTNYVNTGAGTNVTTLDAAATVADPALDGSYKLQSSSSAALDNGTTGYTLSTDLAGNPRVANGTVDRGAYELQDTTAPSAVADLAAGSATETTIGLTWTAPGDDAGTGTATTYDVRYSTSTINAGNFASATAASGEPSPGAAGHAESMTISGLTAGTTYYFALKTSDEVPNTSSVSNVPSLATDEEPVEATGGASTIGPPWLDAGVSSSGTIGR